jgi:hypothetical protein
MSIIGTYSMFNVGTCTMSNIDTLLCLVNVLVLGIMLVHYYV